MSEKRDAFLIEMYKQMFNDINTHIMVVWQCAGVLISSFAVFALVEKKVLPIDLAASVVTLLCGWLCAHLIDAAYWYNRNLVIIANIERQFLNESDLTQIHYYFGDHRPRNKMITHLRIQFALGVGLATLVLLLHAIDRVFPGLNAPFSNFEPQRALPYLLGLSTLVYCIATHLHRQKSYAEFLKNSPGLPVNAVGVSMGIGHGFPANK